VESAEVNPPLLSRRSPITTAEHQRASGAPFDSHATVISEAHARPPQI